MPCSASALPLRFDILSDCLNGSPSRCEKAETLAPECFFPQFLPDLWIFLFQKAAARAFIGIDELAEFCFRLRAEHDMDVVNVMVPLFQSDPVVIRNIQEDFLSTVGNGVIYDLPPVLHYQDQMVIHQIY
jgi:hypothetical protein